MRLNLGAGEDRREGYLSVDLRPDVADVVADVRRLPFDTETVEEILAFDILEHLPPTYTEATLAEWRRVLVPGGLLTLKVPNMYQLCRWVVEGISVQAALTNIYGGHKFGPDGELDHHCVGWTPEMLHRLLHGAGFDVVSDDGGLNMTLEARRR